MIKSSRTPYLILFITFIIFNLLVFLIPVSKSDSFWLAYAFSVIAFGLQIFVWKTAFKGTVTLKSKYFGLPLIYIGMMYLITQLLLNIVILLIPSVRPWIVASSSVLIFGLAMIALLSTDAGKKEVISVEEKIFLKSSYIKELIFDVEMLIETQTDDKLKGELIELSDKIRFSDPMSHESLHLIERLIKSKVEKLDTSKVDDSLNVISEIQLLLLERNKKTKLLK